MTQEAALYSFFNSFNIPAYPNIRVPDEAEYPYITYEQASGLWLDDAFPTVNIYYKGEDLTRLNAKVREIGAVLKNGGITLDCDGGMLWITSGTPFVNFTTDPTDRSIKHAVLNINVEILAI